MGAERYLSGRVRPFGLPNFQQFEPGGTSTSGRLSFEAVAKIFSLKREDTTPNPPFLDDKSIFDEEAPSVAQRRLALNFFNGISLRVDRQEGLYPSPLEIIELHQLHLKAIRASIGEGEIMPEYTLTHVIGASKRQLAYEEETPFSDEAKQQESWNFNDNLQAVLRRAARLEEIDYPIVTQQEAVIMQQKLWEEARTFLQKSDPHYTPDMIGSSTIDANVQYFPEENQDRITRQFVHGGVSSVAHDLGRVRERSLLINERYGEKEAIASATNFGHDDIRKYSLVNVLGAAKREVLRLDVKKNWGNNYVRDMVTAYMLLSRGVGRVNGRL